MIEYNFNFSSNKGSFVATYFELKQFLNNLDLFECENDTYYKYKAIIAKSIENAIENNSFLTSKQSFKIEVETFNLFIIYTLALFTQITKSKKIKKYDKYFFEEIISQIFITLEKSLKSEKDFDDIYKYINNSKMDFTTYNLDYIEYLTVKLNDDYSPDARKDAFKSFCYKLLRYPQKAEYYEFAQK